ncbi:MAG: DUF1015 domain-containing protein [Aeromicrobium sp.]|nr:DUF1015 domain-containing protein [Aeromicrobium sp.]
MSLVRPFCAHVFRHAPGADISALVAPPYDVISPDQRETLLAGSPHNVVALELPDGPLDPTAPDNRYETGRATWESWCADGTIAADESPAIYVLEQSWERDGHHVRRRAFIAAVRLHPFADGIVLPHERTLPKALSDRFELLRSTRVNLSQVFGLFSDPAGQTDDAFDAAMADAPLLSATDADGVASRLWAIRDAATISAVQSAIGEGPIYIADGHHRYTTALAYRDERRARAETLGMPAEEPGYDRVMMALVNMDGPDLLVLPTHRLARAEGAFDEGAFWAHLERYFDLAEAPSTPDRSLASADRTSFVIRARSGRTHLATMRADVDPAQVIDAEHSDEWKRLDVAVLQELVLKPVFGITTDEPASLERLSFVKDAGEALAADADAAFVLAPTRMDQMRAVALGGETMPQKSTYFYPKLLSGLLFRALD